MASGTIIFSSSKMLWKGNFTSGSITVPNAANYKIFEIILEGGIPCFGNTTYGSGGYPEYGSSTMVPCGYRLGSTVSGNSIVFSITSENKGGTANGIHVPIVTIRGIG